MNYDMQLSPHFWLSEFTVSETAVRRGVNNQPTEPSIANLRVLTGLLEAVRVHLGAKPIHINSGYRCPTLNALVGGSFTSAHLTGRAADFVCPSYGSPLEICRRLSDVGLPFDKMIMEGGWVHIQIAEPEKQPRKLVYTAHFGESTTYTKGLT